MPSRMEPSELCLTPLPEEPWDSSLMPLLREPSDLRLTDLVMLKLGTLEALTPWVPSPLMAP